MSTVKNLNGVANQFVIENEKEITFQSYNSTICIIYKNGGLGYDKVVKFGKNWNFSTTTAKHLYKFLKEYGLDILSSKKAIEEAIKRGYARLNESIAVLYDETL